MVRQEQLTTQTAALPFRVGSHATCPPDVARATQPTSRMAQYQRRISTAQHFSRECACRRVRDARDVVGLKFYACKGFFGSDEA